MKALLIEQRSTIRLLKNTIQNFEKIATTKRTAAVAEGRLQLLRERWTLCQQLDVKISLAASESKQTDDEYFTDEEFYQAEEAFEEAHDFLQEKLSRLKPPTAPAANSTALEQSTSTDQRALAPHLMRLAPVEIVKFSGNYEEWPNFKGLFETMIIKYEALSDVQRLHYLKTNVTGEAARLLQHFAPTEENFRAAWDMLNDTYDDKRAIIDAYFKSFLCLPAITVENAKDLKNLRDRTRESLRALNNLGCVTDSWSPIIVYLTVQRLDVTTAREWEMQLGATSTYPELDTLITFLSARIRALEKTGSIRPANRANAKHKNMPSNSEIRSLSSTNTRSTCIVYEGSHDLYKCEQFRSQTLAQRREIAKEKGCCFNCLRRGHKPRECPSKFTCMRCKRKHHTLLHQDQSSESPGSSRSPNTAPESAPNVSAETSVTTHHAQHAQAKEQFTLLATAMVTVCTISGRRLRIRALLDQGSQSTLIKESVVQLLRTKRFPVNAIVKGVGEVDIGTARTRVNVVVEPCNSQGESLAISALVLPTLTCYTPRSSTPLQSWDHLSGIVFADPQPNGNEPIGLIIGADYYGALLRPGLRQGPVNAPTAQETLFRWILPGPISSSGEPPDSLTTHHCSTSEDLHAALARFWEIEELPRVTKLSEDEQKCEDHFVATHQRDEDGRYIVRLPFKSDPPSENR